MPGLRRLITLAIAATFGLLSLTACVAWIGLTVSIPLNSLRLSPGLWLAFDLLSLTFDALALTPLLFIRLLLRSLEAE